MQKINVIIPVLNERESIGKVLREIPEGLADEVIVVDNGSTDNSAEVARQIGATVLTEKKTGYGSACLRGLEYIAGKRVDEKPEIIVFIDGDYSDYPSQMKEIVQPILSNKYDMVIGSRAKGKRERGSMLFTQLFGNWLATRLMRLFFGARFSDLGPFRAISYEKLLQLGMRDRNYGWTIEMQIKAVKHNLAYTEIPVDYRKRIGKSKVTGTIKGTVSAGYKIILTIIKYL